MMRVPGANGVRGACAVPRTAYAARQCSCLRGSESMMLLTFIMFSDLRFLRLQKIGSAPVVRARAAPAVGRSSSRAHRVSCLPSLCVCVCMCVCGVLIRRVMRRKARMGGSAPSHRHLLCVDPHALRVLALAACVRACGVLRKIAPPR